MEKAKTSDPIPAKHLRGWVELAVLFIAGLATIFWIIPAQTTPSTNFGLSPQMVPIVCVSVIVCLAIVQFSVEFFANNRSAIQNPARSAVALLLVVSTTVGIWLTGSFGLIVGGVATVFLASLCVGERRFANLALMAASAGCLLYSVEISGL